MCLILIPMLMTGFVSPAQASEENIPAIVANEDYIYTTNLWGDIQILRYIGKERHVQIPEKIDNKQVVSLGEYSFMGTDIISVVLPDTLARIHNEAFYDCHSLMEVTISEGIGFGDGVFRNCTNLKTVNFSEYVTSLGTNMFYGCKSLEKVILPDRIKEIPKYAFAYCSNLTNADYPDQLENIGEYAFYKSSVNCYYSLPATLKIIKSHAFANTRIASLILPNNLETVGFCAFEGCKELEIISIPSSVTTIDGMAFANCSNLRTVQIPEPNKLLVVSKTVLQGTPLESEYSFIFPEDDNKTYYFYMPESWLNEYAYTAGIFWWEGTDACSSWPGYKAKATDVDGIYCYDVPADVTCIFWNNYLDGGTNISNPIYQAAIQTRPIYCEQYLPGENDNYPNGIENFDGMIYVIDIYKTYIDDCSGKMICTGEWYYYYGDRTCGFTPNKGDGEIFEIDDFFLGADVTIPTHSVPDSPAGTVCPTVAPTCAPTESPWQPPTETEPLATEAPTENDTAPTDTPTTPECTECPTESHTPTLPTESSTSDELESETDFDSIESAHRIEAYDALRKNMETWASLGWDVRIRGDVNSDLVVNIRDATIIQKHLAGISVQNILLKNADVNTDGFVNIRDATLIQKKVAGLVSSFD